MVTPWDGPSDLRMPTLRLSSSPELQHAARGLDGALAVGGSAASSAASLAVVPPTIPLLTSLLSAWLALPALTTGLVTDADTSEASETRGSVVLLAAVCTPSEASADSATTSVVGPVLTAATALWAPLARADQDWLRHRAAPGQE